ncbi:hypothetical protein [Micromonospora sp. CPCC 205561]|uniref:hypothetical protein n=1 Tax=Micromonospora sp. CPCC 205561 TaxID=3122407 RepID=UPI002FEF812B
MDDAERRVWRRLPEGTRAALAGPTRRTWDPVAGSALTTISSAGARRAPPWRDLGERAGSRRRGPLPSPAYHRGAWL